MLRFLGPILAVATAIGHAFSRDSDGGKHVTRAELKEIGDQLLGIASDAAEKAATAPITVGDDVLVRIGDDHAGEPILRPAKVVRAWPGVSYVNVQVFLDGTNDAEAVKALTSSPTAPVCILWLTSVAEGTGVREWRRA